MLKKIIIITALSALSMTAVADFNTVARAYELKLSNFRLPITPNSSLGMRTCAECSMQALRVTSNTQYSINGEAMDLKEFRKRVFQIRNRDKANLLVKHHLETDTVTKVSVSLPRKD